MADNTPEAAIDDQLAITRTLPIPDKEAIPQVPANFRPTDLAIRSRRLRSVGVELEAELASGIEECAALGKDLAQDLGEFAPPAEKAALLAAENKQVNEALARAYAQVAYLEERKAIIVSDSILYIEKTKKEYDYHAERKPQIIERYKRFRAFFEARSRAISEGIAESKKKNVP